MRIRKAKNGEYMFRVFRGRKVFLRSERYSSMNGAADAAAEYLSGEAMIKIRRNKEYKFFFIVTSKNGRVVATSNDYKTKDACYNGAMSLIHNVEAIKDETTRKKRRRASYGEDI